jgi:hypothetical protein
MISRGAIGGVRYSPTASEKSDDKERSPNRTQAQAGVPKNVCLYGVRR